MKDKNNNKLISINVRMTEKESKEIYHVLKDEYGVNISAYVRRCLRKHLQELKELERLKKN